MICGESATPKASSVPTWNCACSALVPRSTSKCQSGRVCTVHSVADRAWRSASCQLSGTSTSLGTMRASSEPSCAKGALVARNSPDESTSHARPNSPLRLSGGAIASSTASDFASSSAGSVRVPGVTTRTTLRSTGPLLVAGSPICSQIATLSPSFTSFARYCSTDTTGTPAIFTGAPPEAPRDVSVMLSRRAARSASS